MSPETQMNPDEPHLEAEADETDDSPAGESSGAGNSKHSKAMPHRAAKRTLELIEALAETDKPLSLSELAVGANLPKSTAHSLVHTLTVEGFIERDDASGKHSLGPRMLRLMGRLPDQFSLPRIARPVMQRLADRIGETTLVGIRRGNGILYVEQVEAPQFIRYVAPIGEIRPLHCTSIGKIFIAELGDEQLRALLEESPPKAYTGYTKTEISEIIAEARAVREAGVAMNREESISGVTAVAAPIYGRSDSISPLIGGLSVVGPSDRMAGKLQEAKELLVAAAAEISPAAKPR